MLVQRGKSLGSGLRSVLSITQAVASRNSPVRLQSASTLRTTDFANGRMKGDFANAHARKLHSKTSDDLAEAKARSFSTIQEWISSRPEPKVPEQPRLEEDDGKLPLVVTFEMHMAERGEIDAVVKGPNWATLDMLECRKFGDKSEEGSGTKDSATKSETSIQDESVAKSVSNDESFEIAHKQRWQKEISNLRSALSDISTSTPETTIEYLEVGDDTPSHDEWQALGERFAAVRWLAIEAGFNENWNDGNFPLHWPLERLVISSACGEKITTPAILDGTIPHLVLLLTCGLRFEGPSNDELGEMDELEGAPKTEMEEQMEQGGPKMIYLPGRSARWLMNKYASDGTGKTSEPLSQEAAVEKPPSRMHTLEILENDAIDTFFRYSLACGHVIKNLERLNIRSTTGLDLHICPEEFFPVILGQLDKLKHLELSISNTTFSDPAVRFKFAESFPPNLESLKFRGPALMAQGEGFDQWISAFGKTEFLPKLKTLSFVLDVDDGNYGAEPLDEETLDAARRKVDILLEAARKRNVVVEEFRDAWVDLPWFN